MWALKLLLIPLFFYLALLASIYLAQTSIIFPARLVAGEGPVAPGAVRLEVGTADGSRLQGLLLPRRSNEWEPVIVAFAGNAWNAADAGRYLAGLLPGADVVVFHYRGYDPSTGRPSAAALLADGPLIYDAVAARFPDRPIVAVGFSIGTGVAAHLARKRPLAGAILVTPFDALAEVGHEHYPWLPVRLLLRHHMHPAADLEASQVPVALIVAGRDSIIPPRRAEALARRVRNLVYQRTIPGAGHNDIYQHPDFPPTLTDALKRVSTAS